VRHAERAELTPVRIGEFWGDGRSGVSVTVIVDVGDLGADWDVVDALARLLLATKRRGGAVELRNVAPDLADLLELAGLRDYFCCDGSVSG
jgi:hypothetical protein